MEDKIKTFLSENLLIDFGDGVDEHSDLFQLGLIDSQAYMEIIRFLEAEFSLELTDEQILSNVFVSLSGMVSLVAESSEMVA
jgi:acyl carrier protein